jgi:hypothetical protein
MLQREINPVDGQGFRLSFNGRNNPMSNDAPVPSFAAASGAGARVPTMMMMTTMTMTRMRGGCG